MKFEDSGLLNDKLVEEAFNYAQAYTLSLTKESMLGITELVDADFKDDLEALEEAYEFGDLTEEEYNLEKADLEQYREQALADITPEDIAYELGKLFRDSCLAPALEIQQYSDKSSPQLIAAALLSHAARDPIDCEKIAEKFGAGIAHLIAERLHIEAYPGAYEDNLAAASDDAKRLFMAELTNSFREAAATVTKLAPDEQAFLPHEQAEKGYQEGKLMWGTDKKLDARLVDTFNQAAQLMASPYRLEVNPQGQPELIKGTPRNTEKQGPTTGPRKPTIFGDDGF